MKQIHSLLKRQLKQYGDGSGSLPKECAGFLEAVNDAYWQSDADRAMLERSLDLSSQELIQSSSNIRAVFERIINSSVDGILAFDRDCRYTVWNPGMERITCLGKVEALGKSALDLIPLFKEVGKDGIFSDTLAGHTLIAKEQLHTISRTGRQVFLEGHFSPLRNESGEIMGGFAIIRDITDQKLAEDARRKASEALDNEVRTLESFVYTVSHDLKSPVVAMNGMASMMKEEYAAQLDDRAQHYIDRIISNANYMEELIQGLLTLSRIGRRQKPQEQIETKETIQNILEMHRDRFTQHHIEVTVHSPLPHFMFDPIQSAQLFQNLITNAVKFMGNQSHPRIEIGGKELKDGVEFYVKDNGIGIDPAYHEKIFAIFQRLQDVKTEGTGVGLSIVKKIIDLNGGTIRIESKKGEGATFFVFLPR